MYRSVIINISKPIFSTENILHCTASRLHCSITCYALSTQLAKCDQPARSVVLRKVCERQEQGEVITWFLRRLISPSRSWRRDWNAVFCFISSSCT